jgi:hypothetical protein
MYRIIGSDQQEYGPVSAEEVRRWIMEGRLHPRSLARANGTTEWRPLSTFPELAGTFALQPAGTYTAPQSMLPVQQGNSMATLGLVFSCLGLLCCGCAPLGLLGVVFSCIGLSEANRNPAATGKAAAIAGIVIGILSLVGTVVSIALGLFGSMLEAIGKL